MNWLAALITLVVAYQPPSGLTERPSPSEQAVKGFELYCAIADTNPALADDHVDDGASLLYYRAAQFVHSYGKADPVDAIRAAAIVAQIPEVQQLGARLNARPREVEQRDGANALADREWFVERTAALMQREDLGAVAQLITDTDLPLPGRVRVDILSDKEREEQFETRWTVLVTALQSYRESSGNTIKLNDEDSKAASKLVHEQLARDYMRINGYLVRVRGHANACALLDVHAVAQALLDWVGPALTELEGAENLTIAPVESGWVVVDADTGWSLRDPTIGKFSERDVLMLHKGLQARGQSDRTAITEITDEAPKDADGSNTRRPSGK